MNTLKLVSILIVLCGVLSLSGCLGDGGNTLSVYSTGSIYKTSTGTSYMFIDRAGISATSAELQGERLEVGDRILATIRPSISIIREPNWRKAYTMPQLQEYINSIVKAIHSTILYPLLLVTHCPPYMV